MNWVLLDVEAIKKVQADLIDQYGGSHGLRDAGLLESAVQRAENKIYFQPDSTVATVGASMSCSDFNRVRRLARKLWRLMPVFVRLCHFMFVYDKRSVSFSCMAALGIGVWEEGVADRVSNQLQCETS